MSGAISLTKSEKPGLKTDIKRVAQRTEKVGYLLLLPFYVFYFFFILVPVIAALFLSFTNYDFYKTMNWVGLKNYINIFGDDVFVKSVWNTLRYGILTIIPQMVIGLAVAIALNGNIAFKKFSRSAFYIPFIFSMVAVSMIWMWIYDPSYGFLNKLLVSLGLAPKQWLFDARYALNAITVMSVWKVIGYNMVVYLAGLQSIPGYLYEAALVDGAGAWKRFVKITFPMLSPTTFFLFVTACINTFKVFEQVNVMTNGGPMDSTTTIVHQIYNKAFIEFKMGYASSMSIVMLIIIALITLANMKYGNQGNDLDIG